MAMNLAVARRQPDVAAPDAASEQGGLAAHPHCLALASATGSEAARDLADAVHLLCSLYGRYPGLVELALCSCPSGFSRDWLLGTVDAFEQERLYLVRLAAAVGPLPSTPRGAETENSLSQQRRGIETLLSSERRGCALGAIGALVDDWTAVRSILDRAAARMGLEPPANLLPDRHAVAAVIGEAGGDPAAKRALAFGAEQLRLQNCGLIDLLEARAEARAGS